MIDLRKDDGRAFKCTLCYDRLKDGQTPGLRAGLPDRVDPVRRARASCASAPTARLAELHDKGVDVARLYGRDPDDGVGGDGAFFLLLDEPEVYGLPPDPVVTTRDLGSIWKHVGAAAAALAAVGVAVVPGDGADEGATAMVPEPEFESYYGRQIIKTPTWKTPDVPLYLFLGGMAGASAVLAEGAALTGNAALERVTRLVAASGAGVGTVFLVHDLGRPERFLHMLRVIKPTSPLSVGSFILAPFSALSSAAAASLPDRPAAAAGTAGRPRGCRVRPAARDVHRRPARQHRRTRLARGPPRAAVPFRRLGCQAAGGMALLLTPVQHRRPGPPDGDRGSGHRAHRVESCSSVGSAWSPSPTSRDARVG